MHFLWDASLDFNQNWSQKRLGEASYGVFTDKRQRLRRRFKGVTSGLGPTSLLLLEDKSNEDVIDKYTLTLNSVYGVKKELGSKVV